MTLAERAASQTPGQPALAPVRSFTPAFVACIVCLLFLVSVLNQIDRQLPFILAQAIKIDLRLSDTQLGLLGGIAFSLVYCTLALPLARLADRWSAKWVLAGSVFLWSLTTAAGGLAQGFWSLAFSRVGVAAGEAGSSPPSYAMITSLVSARRRGLAMGAFSLGVPAGGMLGLALGGWLAELHNWRYAMIAVGLPGVLLAAILGLVIPNVRSAPTQERAASLLDSARRLFAFRSYRLLFAGVTVFGVGAYGSFTFTAPFLMRAYGLHPAEVGLKLGLVNGLAGAVGAFGAGWLGDILARRNKGHLLRLPAVAFALTAPFLALALFAHTSTQSLVFLAIHALAHYGYLAPCFAVTQLLAKSDTRAMSSSILLLGINLFGASTGPFLVGLLSDHLMPIFGSNSLRYALCVAVASDVLAAILLWMAAKTVPADIAASQAANPD